MMPLFNHPWAKAFLSLLALCLICQGCDRIPTPVPAPEVPVMTKLPPAQNPRFSDDMGYDGLVPAIEKSLSYLEKLPEDRLFSFGEDIFSRNHMIDSLQRFASFILTEPSSEELNKFLADHYRIYRSRGSDDGRTVLFTGYYEPILAGSLTPSETYPYPLYAYPDDLVSVDLSLFSSEFEGERIVGRISSQTLVPYFDREAIDVGRALAGRATPLAWVSDPVDLFFLHIQGSGKICLEDGRTLNVHYHASNGRPYRSIGKTLIDSGKLSREEMSMQALREYLKTFPEERENILNSNPSYVFFKTEVDGPIGCLGETLTTGRSIAVDRRIFPMAALSFIQTQKPVIDGNGRIQRWENFSRFALNQDTGGAIRGPGRADLFWGNGPYAEIAAGHMKHDGDLFFLVMRPSSSPLPSKISSKDPGR